MRSRAQNTFHLVRMKGEGDDSRWRYDFFFLILTPERGNLIRDGKIWMVSEAPINAAFKTILDIQLHVPTGTGAYLYGSVSAVWPEEFWGC